MSTQLTTFKKSLRTLITGNELALPSNVDPEAFRNAAIVAATDNAAILNCDEGSIFKSLRILAMAGLVPDGREAALVPFSGRCTAMPMVFGLIKTARNSGQVLSIRAHIVYQKELDDGRFSYIIGDEERITHEPILFGERGDLIGAYAIAKLRDGELIRQFMNHQQIEKVRMSGASQKKSAQPVGIWKAWYEEMAEKSVIRRLCKRLPVSSEDLRQINAEEDHTDLKDVTPPKSLQDRLEDAQATPAPENTPTGPEDAQEPGSDAIEGTAVEDATQDVGFPGDPEWNEGMKAFAGGIKLTDCPYKDNPKMGSWIGGWKVAQGEAT